MPATTATDLAALGLAYLAGLNSFIQKHIWDPPGALWFMVLLYTIAFVSDLVVKHRAGQLTWVYVRTQFIRTLTRVLGGVTLLYIATNVAKYSALYFWMPQGVFALLLAGVLIAVVKNFSTLGVISAQVATFINSKINTTTKKLENDSNDQVAAPPAEE